MTSRERLPNRRMAETFELQAAELRYVCTIGRFVDGRLAEIFLSNDNAGSHADACARDSAVIRSIALQHGVQSTCLHARSCATQEVDRRHRSAWLLPTLSRPRRSADERRLRPTSPQARPSRPARPKRESARDRARSHGRPRQATLATHRPRRRLAPRSILSGLQANTLETHPTRTRAEVTRRA
jgi:hypothetical protein